MSNRTIYDALRAAGLTAEGACGLMGNMMAESGMKSNIAQRGMTQFSDQAYTEAANNGIIDFAHDAVGYGLCQWTHSSRKAALLVYAKSMGVSVGDEAMQVSFCIQELQQDFPMVMLKLKTSHDINECSDRVCDQYEMPADKNYGTRSQYARQFFNEFCGSGALMQEPQNASAPATATEPDFYNLDVLEIQAVMTRNGYWGRPDGYKSAEFFAALQEFVNDMQKC